MFGWSQEIPPEIDSAPHIRFIGTKIKDPKTKISFKVAKSAFRNIFKYRNRKEIIQLKKVVKRFLSGTALNISEKILAHEIEIAWSLGLDCPTMEVTYIATVWDLQHRVQPYYPEVSMEGEWNDREIFYSEVLRRAAFIVTGTTAGQQEVRQLYNISLDKIKIIPFATPKFALEASPCNSYDREKVLKKYDIAREYLFYPAQFWPHKNHIGLLLALKYLKDKYDLSLCMVFAGSDKGNMSFVKQKASELCLLEKIKFTGFIPCEDLILLYQNALALTFVTFAGPDNLPPLEAFALGCPVIASRVSGAEEQLEDAAILVNPKEPEEIAKAIFSLKENPNLRHTLIQRGLTRAKRWTGKDYVGEICSILDEFAPIRRCWSSNEAFNSDVS